MKFNRSAARSVWAIAAAAALGLAALGAAGVAQAGDVFWSVGVSSPGIAVGVANAPPVYYQPAPVYYQPAPVYVQPAPVYVQPRPVYLRPAPVYYAPAPVYQAGWAPPGRAYGWHKKHHHHDWDD